MLKAGALYYTIFVSFITALMGGFLIMNVWTHHAHTLKELDDLRLDRNINSALIVAEESPELVPGNDSANLDLYDDGRDVVKIEKRYWGAYELITASAGKKSARKAKMAIYGKELTENEHSALYMTDNGYGLSICGLTNIDGDCYLPKAGIKPVYIEGTGYTGNKLINGSVKESKTSLPDLSFNYIPDPNSMANMVESSCDTVADFSYFESWDTISRSFFKKCLLLYSSKWVTVAGTAIIGNIKIVSSKGVTLSGTSFADNIIVTAPKVEVESGFTGNLQIFATDTISINNNVNLDYPSVLAIAETTRSNPLIHLAAGSSLSGDIVLTVKNNEKPFKGMCMIDKNSFVTGRIVCNGLIELKGKVIGSVLTNGFLLRTTSQVYENSLLNAAIDFTSLPDSYCGTLITKPVERYKMIKWLD